MVLDFAVGPRFGKSDSSGMKDVLSDSQLRKNDIVLRDVADDFPVSAEEISLDLSKSWYRYTLRCFQELHSL